MCPRTASTCAPARPSSLYRPCPAVAGCPVPQAGITLVGFAGFLEGGDPLTPEGSWAAALGMLLVVLAEVVQAAQVTGILHHGLAVH